MNGKPTVLLPVMVVTVLIVSAVMSCPTIYATDAETSAVVQNAAPTVDVDLTPDDDPLTPGVQVINSEPTTKNKTVTISAYVTDLNGYDDLIGVIANITGPSIVEDSPANLSFDSIVNPTTALYKGSFNLSEHTEGEYDVEVTAADAGGLTGVATMKFSYLHGLVVTTYDYRTGAGTDKWAYRYQHSEKPPSTNDVPGIEFVSEQYNRISRRDWRMRIDETAGRGNYATHRFKINIDQPADEIREMNIAWNGVGYRFLGKKGASLYVWNYTAGNYEIIDCDNRFIAKLNGELDGDMQNYLSGGNVIFVVVQNSPQVRLWWRPPLRSILGTDYLKLEVVRRA